MVFIVLGLSFPVFSYLAFVLAAIYMFFSSNESAFSIMAFFMPFANIFKPGVNSTSLFTILTLLLVIKLLASCKVFRASFFVLWAYLFVVQILGCLWNIPILIKQSMILLLIYGYFNSCNSIPRELTLNLSFGLVISCFLAYFSGFIPGLSLYMAEIRAYEISSDVLRFTGLYSDPNYLSLVIILAFVSLLILVRMKLLKKRYLILCAFLIYFGLQTISKSFYLMLAIVCVLYFVLLVRRRQYIVSSLFVVFISILAVFLANNDSVLVNYFFTRLFYSSDITSGRVDIWKDYLHYFASNPIKLIFGFGIGASDFHMVAHNTYIDFLYYYGITNTCVFILEIFLALRNRKIKLKLQNLIPFICLVIMSFALSCLQMYDFAFLLVFVLELLTEPVNININAVADERQINCEYY